MKVKKSVFVLLFIGGHYGILLKKSIRICDSFKADR